MPIPKSLSDLADKVLAPDATISIYDQFMPLIAKPIVDRGQITGIAINNAGSGYVGSPTVTISGSSEERWARLKNTPLGQMVRELINNWEKVTGYANDNEAVSWLDHLILAREVLISGRSISRADRVLVYQMAWKNKGWLPPDLVLYAAIGGGICGDN